LLENRRKDINGNLERVIPQYMAAVIAWKKSQGRPVYPDANSTLPRPPTAPSRRTRRAMGLSKGPFTTVDGVVEKHTGKDPFIAPKELLDAVKERRFWRIQGSGAELGAGPTFLSSADTTGGNFRFGGDEQARASWLA